MTWKATARTWNGEGEIVEEVEGKTLPRLTDALQDRLHAHGGGLWAVVPHPDNPPANVRWYARFIASPRIRYPSRFVVKTLPDRLLVRVIQRENGMTGWSR